MDAAATLAVARLLGSPALATVGRLWTWAALALWAVVLAGALRRAGRRPRPADRS